MHGAAMKIRTAIFGVYVAASAVGFAVLMALVLRDVRLRYVESMRRTLNDTAAFLAASAEAAGPASDAWVARLAALPAKTDLLRVFAVDADGRVVFDSAHGRDVGAVYRWGGDGALPATAVDAAVVSGELRVRSAVRREGRIVGWVGVGRPLASVTERSSMRAARASSRTSRPCMRILRCANSPSDADNSGSSCFWPCRRTTRMSSRAMRG